MRETRPPQRAVHRWRRWAAAYALACGVALLHGWLLGWLPRMHGRPATAQAVHTRSVSPDETPAETTATAPQHGPAHGRPRAGPVAVPAIAPQSQPARGRPDQPPFAPAGTALTADSPEPAQEREATAEAKAEGSVRLPAPAVLAFEARIGSSRAPATLEWHHDGHRYTLRLEAPGVLRQQSTGTVDATGLAPERYTEQRLRRSERALTIERQAGGGRVVYSARTLTSAWTPGLQDRLSWLVQLLGMAAGQTTLRGFEARLVIAGPAGDQQAWHFQPADDGDGGWADAIHLRHAPAGPFDNGVEVWLDPSPPYWPQRLVIRARSGEALELLRPPR